MIEREWNQESFLDEYGDIVPHPPLPDPRHLALHEALAPYVDLDSLRQYAARGVEIRWALKYEADTMPADVVTLIDTLRLLLTPLPSEQIRSPFDVASLLMIEMGGLVQEQLRVCCL